MTCCKKNQFVHKEEIVQASNPIHLTKQLTTNILKTGTLCLLIMHAPQGLAQELLFSVNSPSGFSSDTSDTTVRFRFTEADQLDIGLRVSVPLSTGDLAGGTLSYEISEQLSGKIEIDDITSTKVVLLDDNKGYAELHMDQNDLAAMTLYEADGVSFQRVVIGNDGTGELVHQDANDFLCLDMPLDTGAGEQIPFALAPLSAPSVDAVKNLQSNPDAAKIIFIDYWGGEISNATDGSNVWNAVYGDPMLYDAYDLDGNTTQFNDEELHRMYHAWLEAAEDYSSFDVNVTTSKAIYSATPSTNRSRIIATTLSTRDTYGICGSLCGGVAYVSAWGSQYFGTGFTFNNTIGSMGMTHSHEAGHQLGLSHDGAGGLNYYSGHGAWGPIMGAPFNKPYVQWSKGEYPNANNTENDYAIINNRLGTKPDDVGDSRVHAESLVLTESTRTISRHISPTQFSGSGTGVDFDVYKIDLSENPGNTMVSLKVAPDFGLATFSNAGGEDEGSNLMLRARLYAADESGGYGDLLAQERPMVGDLPNTNVFEYEDVLPQGVYYLLLNALSPNTNWATGWGDYGHGGNYLLQSSTEMQASVGPAVSDPAVGSVLTSPTGDELFSWSPGNAAAVAWHVYVGAKPGLWTYFNSGGLDSDVSSVSVTGLPTDGRELWLRLWYQLADNSWQYVDAGYTASGSSPRPVITAPVPGTSIGDSQTVYWHKPADLDVQRWRVYAGSSFAASDYTRSSNLPAATQSFEIAGWGNSNPGQPIWVRLLWRVNGKWSRANDMFISSDTPSPPVSDDFPVDP